ncbi:MAG: methylated-DNA--[protein]-cysteine S-methyltransferase [Muribaculaceae bacterium]|nr:methylated-DNA--[protein]-cysteine S-methyltransferase [Muribaculaceae bacterium]
MLYHSPAGTLLISSESGFITSLVPCAGAASGSPENEAEEMAAAWLDAYFSGAPLPSLPPLNPDGTIFQRRVWKCLLEIPRGSVITYGELAARLGSSARAVGQAVGANPIAVLIPCHRVVAAGGRLGGFAHGTEMKRALLNLEAKDVSWSFQQAAEAKLSEAESGESRRLL